MGAMQPVPAAHVGIMASSVIYDDYCLSNYLNDTSTKIILMVADLFEYAYIYQSMKPPS